MNTRLTMGVLSVVNATLNQDLMPVWIIFLIVGVYCLLSYENNWDLD